MSERRAVCVAIVLLALAGILVPASCSLLRPGSARGPAAERWQPRVVTIRGAEGAANMSRSSFLWSVSATEGRPAALPLMEGDLLLCSVDDEKDLELFFPYMGRDGAEITLAVEDSTGLLDGKPVFLALDQAGCEWARDASDDELAALRLVAIGYEDQGGPRRPVLEKLARINPNVGLSCGDPASLREALAIMDPQMLMAERSPLTEEDVNIISGEANLEVLWIEAGGLEDLTFLSRLPNLRTLVLGDWDPEETGPFPRGCDRLRRLTTGGHLKNLSGIAHLAHLEELHLLGSEQLTDISAISRLSGLRCFSFRGSKDLEDLSALEKLPKLEWLGLPQSASQEQFAAILRAHPNLKVLELIECKNVLDLTPLEGLEELEALVLLTEVQDLGPLYQLKSLRLLVLPEGESEAPEKVRELEEALPGCRIVEGKVVCLGSGWVLLLFPAVAVAWLASRRMGRRPSASQG